MPLYFPVAIQSDVINPSRNSLSSHEIFVLGESNSTFTWSSRWQPESQEIVNGSSIAGDHVVIHSSWDIPVTSSQISIEYGFNETREGLVAEPGDHDEWPILLCMHENFVWETFDRVHFGDNVSVSLNLTQNGDPAFDVYYWIDYDHDNEVDLDEVGDIILSADIGGSGFAEYGSFRARKSGLIAIRVYCWNWAYSENMTYTLEVNSLDSIVIENEHDNPPDVFFDTYYLLRNVTANLTLSAIYNSDIISLDYVGITIGNYFEPDVYVNLPTQIDSDNSHFIISQDPPASPVLNGLWNLTWTCSDLNANDTHFFSVGISLDDGLTYQILARNLSDAFYVWDSSGFLDTDYIFRVRAYSLDFTVQINNTPLCSTANPPYNYWPGDYADGFSDSWSSDHIIPPTLPVNTTTQNTSTETTIPISITLVVAIGLSAGMILGLVILEVFRRKGRWNNR